MLKILPVFVWLMLLFGGGLAVSEVVAQCRPPDRPCTPTPAPPEPIPPGSPDRDGDGVPNDEDRCPDSGGPAWNAGCPFVDSDGDGTADENDACPKEGGPDSNSGCPVGVMIETPAAPPLSVEINFPPDECWIGNPNPEGVYLRDYPSLSAPVTGLLQSGESIVSVTDYTDSNDLLWYGVARFGDPANNAYIIDWVSSAVTVASGACEPQRLNLDDDEDTARPYRILEWQLKATSLALNAPNALVQLCDATLQVTYLPGEISGCDDDIPVQFDGSQSLFYCNDEPVSSNELSNCPGAENMILLNTPLLLPEAIQIQPAVSDGTPLSEFVVTGLLNMGQPANTSPGDGEVNQALLATGFNGSLPAQEDHLPFGTMEDANNLMALQFVNDATMQQADWMQSVIGAPNPQEISGYWLVNRSGSTTMMLPMPADDLSQYVFNSQPEPPDFSLLVPGANGGYQLNPARMDNVSSLNIVGYIPQPEPPSPAEEADNAGSIPSSELSDLVVVLNVISPGSITMTNPATPDLVMPLPGARTYVHMQSGHVVMCPENPGEIADLSSRFTMCIEISIAGVR